MAKLNFLTEPITYEQMIELNENYKSGKRKKLNQGLGKDETNAIWFEKNEFLRDFFLRIIGDPEISGVRVYMCEYAKEPHHGLPKNPKFVKQLTVAFVPTVEEDGKHVDLPRLDLADQNFLLTGGALNNGTLCPPDTGCNEV